jgi:hypothetical protein
MLDLRLSHEFFVIMESGTKGFAIIEREVKVGRIETK